MAITSLWIRYIIFGITIFLACFLQKAIADSNQQKLSITQNPGFSHLVANLNSLVKKEAKHSRNHFYIGKYPAEQSFTYMLWVEQKALWILEVGDKDAYHWKQVIHFPRSGNRLDLTKDVVSTKEAVGSSTYLVDQEWVNSVVYDLVIYGDFISVDKDE